MKRIAQGTVLVAIVAASLWAGSAIRRTDTSSAGSASTYRTASVQRRDIRSTVLATGVIRPMVGAEVQVGSRVSGILQTLNVSIGDKVQPGQVLARLDPTESQARLDQANAALETAEVEDRFAQIDLNRARELREQAVIPQSELDIAERRSQLAAANLSQARANALSARIQLEYTVIRAPVSGVVASVSTQVGETVAASFASPTFVTIIDLDRLEIWAYVDETDIGRVEVGQAAVFTVDTYLDTDFTGVVTAIQPKAEIVDNVVNYVTLIEIGPTGGRTLRPEMTATVNILLEGREGVLTLPNGAVRRDSEGIYALVEDATGPQRRAIRTGHRGSDFTEVLEGLQEGDVVLVGSVPNGG
jgi:macrolide-specific efflux system membrane fusion protein